MSTTHRSGSASANNSHADHKNVWTTDNCAFCDCHDDYPIDRRAINSNLGTGSVEHSLLHSHISQERAKRILESMNDLGAINHLRVSQATEKGDGTRIKDDETFNMLNGHKVFNDLPSEMAETVRREGHRAE